MTKDDSARIHKAIWQELERALQDRNHPWRTPVLATVDARGLPAARTIVLRSVDPASQQLGFYTDARSPKVDQLESSEWAILVFWNRSSGWQLRITCTASVIMKGSAVEAAWHQIAAMAAASDYLSLSTPGSPLTSASDGQCENHNLAIVELNVESIDWLELNDRGHRRARVTEDGVAWLVP